MGYAWSLQKASKISPRTNGTSMQREKRVKQPRHLYFPCFLLAYGRRVKEMIHIARARHVQDGIIEHPSPGGRRDRKRLFSSRLSLFPHHHLPVPSSTSSSFLPSVQRACPSRPEGVSVSDFCSEGWQETAPEASHEQVPAPKSGLGCSCNWKWRGVLFIVGRFRDRRRRREKIASFPKKATR